MYRQRRLRPVARVEETQGLARADLSGRSQLARRALRPPRPCRPMVAWPPALSSTEAYCITTAWLRW